MSRETNGVVRQRVGMKPRGQRSLEERLRLKFPGAMARLTALIFRLPARSAVRRAVVRRSVLQGVAAANRGDYEAAFAAVGESCETTFPAALATVGVESVMRAGRSARIDVERRWRADWGEFRFVPEEVMDLGDDRVMVVGHIGAIGLGSGVALDTEWAALYELDGGEVVREQIFLDREEALEAAGLRE
jgi:ketosteroid isomerase-like protein